jgi:hypothetical protein
MTEQLNLTLHKWYQRRDGKIMKCTQVYANTYYMIGGNMYPQALHGRYSYTQETMQLDLMKEVPAPKPKKEGQQ